MTLMQSILKLLSTAFENFTFSCGFIIGELYSFWIMSCVSSKHEK